MKRYIGLNSWLTTEIEGATLILPARLKVASSLTCESRDRRHTARIVEAWGFDDFVKELLAGAPHFLELRERFQSPPPPVQDAAALKRVARMRRHVASQ